MYVHNTVNLVNTLNADPLIPLNLCRYIVSSKGWVEVRCLIVINVITANVLILVFMRIKEYNILFQKYYIPKDEKTPSELKAYNKYMRHYMRRRSQGASDEEQQQAQQKRKAPGKLNIYKKIN